MSMTATMLRRARQRGFAATSFPGVSVIAAVFFAYLYLPILVLIGLSFNENEAATVWTGFSTDWYVVAIGNEAMLDAARNSLVIATGAMLASTIIATLAALGMARGAFRGEAATTGVLVLPLVVPEIVTAVATLLFFSTIGITLGVFSVMLAHTVFCIPFAYLPIRARLDGLDPSLKEAAGDLYANEWRTFRRVTLPLLWPGILSGGLLAFIISLDDFVITFFVSGAGATTLPVYIYSSVRIGVTPEINAISTIMLIVSIAFVSLSMFLASKRK